MTIISRPAVAMMAAAIATLFATGVQAGHCRKSCVRPESSRWRAIDAGTYGWRMSGFPTASLTLDQALRR